MAARQQPPSHPPAEVTLHGVAHGGEAVGRVGDLVTFVAGALPGERVRAAITERKARFQRGCMVEVLDAAPQRETPPCPIFGTCGGCHWQHASYDAQLAYKTTVLTEQLARAARIETPPVLPALPAPAPWHYRNVVQFVPANGGPDGMVRPATSGAGAGPRLLCFRRGHSHALVPVEHCYIADELINRTLHAAPWDALDDRTWHRLLEIQVRVVPGSTVQLTLVATQPLQAHALGDFIMQTRAALPELSGIATAVSTDSHASAADDDLHEVRTIWGSDRLTYALAGNHLEVAAGGFFQVNLGAAEHLVAQALEWLEPAPSDHVLDAYGGVGTFGLAVAPLVCAVEVIEVAPSAVALLPANAARNGHSNVTLRPGPVATVLAKMLSTTPSPSAQARQSTPRGVLKVLLDPPRRGCGPEVTRELARLRPERIVYVSCEPSTLARDLRDLTQSGYRLLASRVIDLFPQTYHLESVNILAPET